MAVKDWADYSRWFIATDVSGGWYVAPPGEDSDDDWEFESFAEAHAAYLDAVTCEEFSPFAGYGPRCIRSRKHEGMHRFNSRHAGGRPLLVNPK